MTARLAHLNYLLDTMAAKLAYLNAWSESVSGQPSDRA